MAHLLYPSTCHEAEATDIGRHVIFKSIYFHCAGHICFCNILSKNCQCQFQRGCLLILYQLFKDMTSGIYIFCGVCPKTYFRRLLLLIQSLPSVLYNIIMEFCTLVSQVFCDIPCRTNNMGTPRHFDITL